MSQLMKGHLEKSMEFRILDSLPLPDMSFFISKMNTIFKVES